MTILHRKRVAGIVALGVLLLSACGGAGAPGQPKQLKSLIIAEPVHSSGYAPIYAAIRKGYFAENGLKVEMFTATGGAHVPAVLSGEAWGFVGGPESNAMAAQQKPDDKLVSIVNIVNRANVYLVAKQGAVDISVSQEPGLSAGIRQRVWDEPFYSFVELGDYAFSVVSVLNSSIKKEPEVAQGFTRAIVKALAGFNDDRALALEVIRAEFPSMDETAIKDSLDRAYADKIWSLDGVITKDALDHGMDTVLKTGVFQGAYTYDELINMQFVSNR